MIFAIVTNEDRNAVSREFFSSKKIPQKNMCHAERWQVLAREMMPGDVVWVIDVKRFGSVESFWNFYQMCIKKGVSLKILANPHLNYSREKRLRSSYKNLIIFMMNVEKKIAGDICKAFKNVNVAEVQRYAGVISINILGEIFSTEGILSRSSL